MRHSKFLAARAGLRRTPEKLLPRNRHVFRGAHNPPVRPEQYACFRRNAPGVWECVAEVALELPSGRIEVVRGTVFVRGTRFMNVDVAELLDEEYEKRRGR